MFPCPQANTNGYWNRAAAPGSTTVSLSPPTGIEVRSRTPRSRFTSDVRSSYQSPPPPYLRRAMVNERAPGGAFWAPAAAVSASARQAAIVARITAGVIAAPGAALGAGLPASVRGRDGTIGRHLLRARGERTEAIDLSEALRHPVPAAGAAGARDHAAVGVDRRDPD